MSTPSSVFQGTFFQQVELFTIANEVIVAATALVAYTHVTTFHLEIAYAWKHPLRPSSVLYILMRYPPLLYQLVTTSLSTETPGCTGVLEMSTWMFVVANAASYVFQIMRTWALCDKNIWLTLGLTLLCLPALGVDVWVTVQTSCTSPVVKYTDIQTNLQLASDLAFESVVVVATVYRTWHLVAAQRSLKDFQRPSIPTMFLQNGLLYYCLFAGTIIGSLVSFNAPYNFGSKLAFYIFQSANRAVRWILLSRFLIEIRHRLEQRNTPPTFAATALYATSISHSFDFSRVSVMEDLGEPGFLQRDKPSLRDDLGTLGTSGTSKTSWVESDLELARM